MSRKLFSLIGSIALSSLALSSTAHAAFLKYELSGVITEVSGAGTLPGTIQAGDVFHATFEYEAPATPQPGGPCTDQARLISTFTFANASMSSLGSAADGCMRNGVGSFLSVMNGDGDLQGWGGHDGFIGVNVGAPLFPVEITDPMWLSSSLSLLLFGPSGLDTVRYVGQFTSIISNAVPEPATMGLLAMGLLGTFVAGARKRRR